MGWREEYEAKQRKIETEVRNLIAIESLEDLGSTFFGCIGAGMSATEAYYASKYVAEKTTTVPPSEIGKINQSKVEKDFFTKAEVEAMSPEEVEKNLEKIESLAMVMKTMLNI